MWCWCCWLRGPYLRATAFIYTALTTFSLLLAHTYHPPFSIYHWSCALQWPHEPVSVTLLASPLLTHLWHLTYETSLKPFPQFLCPAFLSLAPTFLSSSLQVVRYLPLNVAVSQCFVLNHHSLLPGDLILFLDIITFVLMTLRPKTSSPHSAPLSISSGHSFSDIPHLPQTSTKSLHLTSSFLLSTQSLRLDYCILVSSACLTFKEAYFTILFPTSPSHNCDPPPVLFVCLFFCLFFFNIFFYL